MTQQTTTRKLTPMEAKNALTIFRAERARIVALFEESERAAEQDRREGHRAHYCVHGTSRWTDWDNICGPCEDGLTTVADYLPILRGNAINRARAFRKDLDTVMAMDNTARRLGIVFDAMAALDQLMTSYRLI